MKNATLIFKRAFAATLPVIASFLFFGMAFGLMMAEKGYAWYVAFIMSAFIYAGAMQFVTVGLLAMAFNPLGALIMTLAVNARHIFYGISMLKQFEGLGTIKPFVIFGLTDETFSIFCGPMPTDITKKQFMVSVAALNQFYWVFGTLLGSFAGAILKFDLQGIEFTMTSMFIVILINQWRQNKQHLPAVVGVATSLACLLIFGPSQFIIPAMLIIVLLLTLARPKIERQAQ